jgi:LysR family transcriptional regulator, cyn operon transcriptional activator
MINLRALRMFVKTAELGALGSASSQLHLSQPAASRQLSALEDALGVALFYRGGRRLLITPEGADLLAQSRQLLKAADILVDRAQALRGGLTGTLRIAATTHVMASLLAPMLLKHQISHPMVEVQLVEGGAAEQPARLESGEVQLAIMPSGDERFDGRLLYPVIALAVLSVAHRLTQQQVIDITALAQEPLLLLRREFGSRGWFESACDIARFKPRVRLESSAPQTVVELAAAGYGIAVLPSTVAIRTEGVRVVPLVQNTSPIGRWSMVAWDRERPLPTYARQFVEHLVAHSRAEPPGKLFTDQAPAMALPKWPTS